jgi:integrase
MTVPEVDGFQLTLRKGNMAEFDAPFDRWHKRYPKPAKGDVPCRCGTKRNPLYPSADHGRGQQWQARYTDPNGKPRRPMFDTWQQARDHLDKVRVELRAGTWTDPDLGAEKVEFYAKQFIARRKKKELNENTTRAYELHLRKHILPFAGHRIAKSLNRRDTSALVDHLIDKPRVSNAYVVQIFKTWSVLVHKMVDDEDVPLPANIVSRIELPRVEKRVKVALSADQVTALAVAMREVEPRYEALIWIAACAGFREGEAFGLTRGAVAWDEDLLYVTEQRQAGKAVDLKSAASKATLPVDHFLIEKLAEHIQTHPQLVPVRPGTVTARRSRGYVPPPDEELIVTNRYGRPVKVSEFNGKWRAAVKCAGLPKRTRFHDLKHFYTSHLGATGRHDPKTVQALSRHSQFSETWDTYAHPPLAVEGVTVTAFTGLFQAAAPAGADARPEGRKIVGNKTGQRAPAGHTRRKLDPVGA